MVQTCPSKRAWVNRHLYYMETRRHLSRGGSYHATALLGSWALHLNYVAQLVALTGALVFRNWIVAAVSGVWLAVTYAVRALAARRAFKATGEHMPCVWVPLLELRAVWQYLLFRIRYAKADAYDFIRR